MGIACFYKIYLRWAGLYYPAYLCGCPINFRVIPGLIPIDKHIKISEYVYELAGTQDMATEVLEDIARKGICSLESIEQSKKIAEDLDAQTNRVKILGAERLFKSVSDRTRIKLLLLLSRGEMCVCQIAAVSELKQPAISNSLVLMEKAGLLKRERRGKWHFYSLADSEEVHLILKLVEREMER